MNTRGAWRSRHPKLANVLSVAIAAVLVAWPAYGVLQDDFAVPVGRLDGRDFHFHGVAAWVMLVAFACPAAGILVVVSLRLKVNPGWKAGEGLAVVAALAGAFIFWGMMGLKMAGLL